MDLAAAPTKARGHLGASIWGAGAGLIWRMRADRHLALHGGAAAVCNALHAPLLRNEFVVNLYATMRSTQVQDTCIVHTPFSNQQKHGARLSDERKKRPRGAILQSTILRHSLCLEL